MKRNQPISKIMTSDPKSVHTGQKISDVRKLIAEHGFHHVPVTSGAQLVGIISASDVLGISVEGVGSDPRAMDAYLDHQFSIEAVMTTELTKLKTTNTVRDAADALGDGSFHAVPVVDDDGVLVGIVTSTDLIRYLRDLL